MKNLINDVKRHTPKVLPGYNYIKTQSVYIPFKKVTVECLTRRISELNLFFESILKLIDISIRNINEIAEILGVSTGIINEVIVDMVNIDYVFASEGMLIITEKGKKALETGKKVDIQKSYLKDLVVDMITGDVYDADSVNFSNTNSRSVMLETVINIDNTYLDTHFREINDIYQLIQKNNSVFGDSAVTNELYKILGISYSELHYLENKVYIYKSDSSDELLFVFTNDSKDNYKNEFYKQLKGGFHPCQEYFFENNIDFVNKIMERECKVDDKKISQTEVLSKLLFSDKTSEEELLNSFVQDRYALNDTEYLSYLYHFKAFQYNRICICSNYLGKLLSNSFCSQINIIAEKIPVFIIYNKKEHGVEKSIKHFFKTSPNNLHLVPKENVDDDIICFDSEVIMYLMDHIITAFERPISYIQLECCFDKQIVKDEINRIIDKYDLNRFLQKKNC